MENTPRTMDQYQKYIRQLAKDKTNQVFFNSGPEHAAYVMSNIFDNCENEINIYAGSLSGEISERECYVNSLNNFLNRGGKLNILLQAKKIVKTPAIFSILKYHNVISECIKVKVKSVDSLRIMTKGTDEEVHFCTGDEKMYRLEDNIHTFSAQGNFNDEKSAKTLNDIFFKYFNNSEAADLLK